MSDQAVMEKLLQVLNKIEVRLAQIESTANSTIKNSEDAKKEKVASSGLQKYRRDSIPETKSPEEVRMSGNQAYIDAQYYGWSYVWDKTKLLQTNGQPLQDLWGKYLGQTWRIPCDSRFHLTFTKEIMEMIPEEGLQSRLELLQDWNSGMGYGCFEITDYDHNNREVVYRMPRKNEDIRNPYNKPIEDRIMQPADFLPWGLKPFDFSACHRKFVEFNGSKRLAPMYTAPWRRFISVKGLTSCSISSALQTNMNLAQEIAPRELQPQAPVFQIDRNDTQFEMLINNHIQATFANPQVLAWAFTDFLNYMAFHMVVYMKLNITKDDNEDGTYKGATYMVNETWPTGYLYDEETKIVQVSYSMYAKLAVDVKTGLDEDYVSYKTRELLPQYWTIINLQPRFLPTRPQNSEFNKDIIVWDEFNAQNTANTMLRLIYNSMLKAMVSWSDLLIYFDELLNDGKVFMKPKDHDSLLVDDEAFSRSRKYFWALTCLSEFETCVADNIHQWDTSKLIWEEALPDFDPKKWPEIQEQMKKIEIVVEKLRGFRKRFKDHHENVFALRDGLFNASSVMESRAANKLGENVKLLTFVSIFFLPLAFTTSLWSMNTDLLSITTLAYVIVIIAFSTYLVVFNLNSLVRLSRVAYTAQRSRLLSQMRNDESEAWKQRGKRFDAFGFKPKSEVTKPSEWLLSVYALRMIPAWVKGVWPKRKKVDSGAA